MIERPNHSLMRKLVQEFVAYRRCLAVIESCQTWEQSISACRLVHNFGRMFGHSSSWSLLDQKAVAKERELWDNAEYKNRLEEI